MPIRCCLPYIERRPRQKRHLHVYCTYAGIQRPQKHPPRPEQTSIWAQRETGRAEKRLEEIPYNTQGNAQLLSMFDLDALLCHSLPPLHLHLQRLRSWAILARRKLKSR
jgi:hypothetical protein